jgi:UDP-N-acetylmuramate--alanine ligase
MHIFFSGIGGTGIGPLALVAKQAGYRVSGSDKQDSQYISYLKKHGITYITIGQTTEAIAAAHDRTPIDWFVYSSAVSIEQPDHPELQFCRKNGIKTSKRDELLNAIMSQKNLKLLAVAGTHGKTTTTAMMIWALQQLGLPMGYVLPAKSSFADMGAYKEGAEYFVYECDEFDRNFLHFTPEMSLITGIDYDHPDIYPTREDYNKAFRDFIHQSAQVVLWQSDVDRLQGKPSKKDVVLSDTDEKMKSIRLAGHVNRRNAWQVAHAVHRLLGTPVDKTLGYLEKFPGVARRFEQIAPRLYSDYAHTPEKIRGALQLGHEVAGENLVVVYEGLHNTRQHFIRHDLEHLFDDVKQLYIVPSYLAREDQSLELLTPEKLREGLSDASQGKTEPANIDASLVNRISTHLAAGDTVLCLSAGGGGGLDEWLRKDSVTSKKRVYFPKGIILQCLHLILCKNRLRLVMGFLVNIQL